MLEEPDSGDLPFPLFPSSSVVSPVYKTKKQVLLLSEHCHQNTTNSKISWNLLEILSSKFDTYHFGISPSLKSNINCRPYSKKVDLCKIEEPGLGFKTLAKYIESVKPEYLIIYNNLETINQYLVFLSNKISNVKIILYVDMVYYNINSHYVEMLNSPKIDKIFVTSTFWKETFISNKVIRPIGILHYGLDPKPVIKKKDARDFFKMSHSSFTILVPCPNLQQYRYDIIITAYVRLLKKYPSKELHLFCLCSKESPNGYSILDIYCQELFLNNMNVHENLNKILLTKELVLDDVELYNIYNCADIGVCIPENEGLNLASFEMSCIGVPQIIPKSGQFETHCSNILLPLKNRYYLSYKTRSELSEVRAVCVDDLYDAMEKYLLNDDLCSMRKSDFSYSWSVVTDELIKFLLD